MDATQRRAQLETLLTEPAGQPVWEALWKLFLDWPAEAARDESLADAAVRLDAWPDEMRHVSSDWAPLYLDGGDVTQVARLVRSVELYRRTDQGTLELIRLARSPNLAELHQLRIVGCELAGEAWRALSSSPHLRRLSTLEIHHTEIGGDELVTLLQSPVAHSLRRLRLSRLDLRGPALEPVLVALPIAITDLDLSMNGIGPKGAIALIDHVRPLKKLSLADNPLGDDGAIALAHWPHPGLVVLDLSRTGIKASGRAALATASRLAGAAISFE